MFSLLLSSPSLVCLYSRTGDSRDHSHQQSTSSWGGNLTRVDGTDPRICTMRVQTKLIGSAGQKLPDDDERVDEDQRYWKAVRLYSRYPQRDCLLLATVRTERIRLMSLAFTLLVS